MLEYDFTVDNAPAWAKFDTARSRPSPVSPGWEEHFGHVAIRDEPDHRAALHAWTRGSITLVDFINCRNNGETVRLSCPDLNVHWDIGPGAGFGITLGMPPLDWSEQEKIPMRHAWAREPNPMTIGTAYPDRPDTGVAGSPRNDFVPQLIQNVPYDPRHAGALTQWQLSRRYQRAPKGANWDLADEFGFDLNAYHEEEWTKTIDGREVPGAKYWDRLTIPVEENGVTRYKPMETWVATHLATQELAAAFELFRDPRAYDQLHRLTESFLRWQWDVGPGVGDPDYGQNTRVKGRTIEGIGWMGHCAIIGLQSGKVAHMKDEASKHALRILGLWEELDAEGCDASTANYPRGDHLMVPWECTWMISLIGWGAGLCWRWLGCEDSKVLADRVCDWMERRGRKVNTWFIDVASDPSNSLTRPYTQSDLGTGTFTWQPRAFQAADRTDSAYYQDAMALCDAKGNAPQDPFKGAMA